MRSWKERTPLFDLIQGEERIGGGGVVSGSAVVERHDLSKLTCPCCEVPGGHVDEARGRFGIEAVAENDAAVRRGEIPAPPGSVRYTASVHGASAPGAHIGCDCIDHNGAFGSPEHSRTGIEVESTVDAAVRGSVPLPPGAMSEHTLQPGGHAADFAPLEVHVQVASSATTNSSRYTSEYTGEPKAAVLSAIDKATLPAKESEPLRPLAGTQVVDRPVTGSFERVVVPTERVGATVAPAHDHRGQQSSVHSSPAPQGNSAVMDRAYSTLVHLMVALDRPLQPDGAGCSLPLRTVGAPGGGSINTQVIQRILNDVPRAITSIQQVLGKSIDARATVSLLTTAQRVLASDAPDACKHIAIRAVKPSVERMVREIAKSVHGESLPRATGARTAIPNQRAVIFASRVKELKARIAGVRDRHVKENGRSKYREGHSFRDGKRAAQAKAATMKLDKMSAFSKRQGLSLSDRGMKKYSTSKRPQANSVSSPGKTSKTQRVVQGAVGQGATARASARMRIGVKESAKSTQVSRNAEVKRQGERQKGSSVASQRPKEMNARIAVRSERKFSQRSSVDKQRTSASTSRRVRVPVRSKPLRSQSDFALLNKEVRALRRMVSSLNEQMLIQLQLNALQTTSRRRNKIDEDESAVTLMHPRDLKRMLSNRRLSKRKRMQVERELTRRKRKAQGSTKSGADVQGEVRVTSKRQKLKGKKTTEASAEQLTHAKFLSTFQEKVDDSKPDDEH